MDAAILDVDAAILEMDAAICDMGIIFGHRRKRCADSNRATTNVSAQTPVVTDRQGPKSASSRISVPTSSMSPPAHSPPFLVVPQLKGTRVGLQTLLGVRQRLTDQTNEYS